MCINITLYINAIAIRIQCYEIMTYQNWNLHVFFNLNDNLPITHTNQTPCDCIAQNKWPHFWEYTENRSLQRISALYSYKTILNLKGGVFVIQIPHILANTSCWNNPALPISISVLITSALTNVLITIRKKLAETVYTRTSIKYNITSKLGTAIQPVSQWWRDNDSYAMTLLFHETSADDGRHTGNTGGCTIKNR